MFALPTPSVSWKSCAWRVPFADVYGLVLDALKPALLCDGGVVDCVALEVYVVVKAAFELLF